MIVGVIPARYASTRFPGKPLVYLGGMSILERCYRQCLTAQSLERVIIATDDKKIFDHAMDFGAEVVMTNADHPSGTDRVAEAIADLDEVEIVINIQGDEPFIHPQQIDQLATALQSSSQYEIATLAGVISDFRHLQDPNKVKVVMNEEGGALYFSRSAIPYFRQKPVEQWLDGHQYYQHVGLYGFRRQTLLNITRMPLGKLEQIESLEQLRWLEAGIPIHVSITALENIGIDTPEDLEMAKLKLSNLL